MHIEFTENLTLQLNTNDTQNIKIQKNMCSDIYIKLFVYHAEKMNVRCSLLELIRLIDPMVHWAGIFFFFFSNF